MEAESVTDEFVVDGMVGGRLDVVGVTNVLVVGQPYLQVVTVMVDVV